MEHNRRKEDLGIVSKSVLDQINLEASLLKSNPRFSMLKQHRIYHALASDASRHSVTLELPNGQKLKKGRARKIAEENISSAYEYFMKHFNGVLEEELVMDTSTLIEPSLGSIARYRSFDSPTTYAAESLTIYPRDVAKQMEKFIQKNGLFPEVIDKAVHAHFDIARIHPFADGNGLLARLIQNGILTKAGLPSIVIEPFERKEYLDLIKTAVESYKQHRKMTSEQGKFANYLALKIRDSLVKTKRLLVQ